MTTSGDIFAAGGIIRYIIHGVATAAVGEHDPSAEENLGHFYGAAQTFSINASQAAISAAACNIMAREQGAVPLAWLPAGTARHMAAGAAGADALCGRV